MSRRKPISPRENLPSLSRESRKPDESEESSEDEVAPEKSPHQQNGAGYWGWVILVAVVLGLVLFQFTSERKPDFEEIENELKKVLSNVKRKFPTQEKQLWPYLLSVLAGVCSSDISCPKVILLIDRDDGRTSQCFVRMVANQSAPVLPFEEKRALFLNGDDLNCDNCVEVHREKAKKHGIVVIQHLENFPIKSADSLHFFCDEHETEFAKAAYLLTMTVRNIEKDATKTAENALRASWKSMQKDNLDALISRLTSLVVFVQPETTLNCD
ncbi:uncharacterized protein LOC117646722 [Thrips palmi]|uniref:Uncharacterized protein LOC117646722 n=1 Tax=Thrips palmi TaxID=161013 RepID=A0A6P8YUK5_THRPL|nr:uncharacterized protein LOC117646722 [Thrips palmi]